LPNPLNGNSIRPNSEAVRFGAMRSIFSEAAQNGKDFNNRVEVKDKATLERAANLQVAADSQAARIDAAVSFAAQKIDAAQKAHAASHAAHTKVADPQVEARNKAVQEADKKHRENAAKAAHLTEALNKVADPKVADPEEEARKKAVQEADEKYKQKAAASAHLTAADTRKAYRDKLKEKKLLEKNKAKDPTEPGTSKS
jgi:hypothetical protein